MGKHDFLEWLKHHDKRFVGVAKFVATNQCTEAWFGVLSRHSLEHAKQASDSMFSGDLDLDNVYGYSHHPRCVSRECRRLERMANFAKTPERNEQRGVARCYQCMDDGVIQVYHSRYYSEIRKGMYPDAVQVLDMISVACPHCEAGQRKQDSGARQWTDKMFQCRAQDEEEVGKFVDHVRGAVAEHQTVAGFIECESEGDDDIWD